MHSAVCNSRVHRTAQHYLCWRHVQGSNSHEWCYTSCLKLRQPSLLSVMLLWIAGSAEQSFSLLLPTLNTGSHERSYPATAILPCTNTRQPPISQLCVQPWPAPAIIEPLLRVQPHSQKSAILNRVQSVSCACSHGQLLPSLVTCARHLLQH